MYPMSLSGGMRQRVMIAMALVCEPQLLIADEPTTALDVTIQAQIMDLLEELSQRTGTALLFITHNLGLVAESCSRMLTMYAGQVVENGPVDEILSRPLHPYTAGLLGSLPQVKHREIQAAVDSGPRAVAARYAGRMPVCTALQLRGSRVPHTAAIACSRRAPRALLVFRRTGSAGSGGVSDILTVENLGIEFPARQRHQVIKAVDGVDFRVAQGETFGVIGESGSGKSTLGRCIVCLVRPSSGRVLHDGADPFALSAGELRQHRRTFQIIFQDPNAALDPRMTILDSVREPLDVARIGSAQERRRRALTMLDRVALSLELANRYPHEISGGQKQRANIARALVLEPRLIVCDEVVAALDVSIQADMLNLFAELQREFSLTYVFISHDLRVVAHVSDRVAVMYFGKLVELGPAQALMAAAAASLHAGAALGRAGADAGAPAQPEQRIILKGEIPSRWRRRADAGFIRAARWRLPSARRANRSGASFAPGHFAACHFAGKSAAVPVEATASQA